MKNNAIFRTSVFCLAVVWALDSGSVAAAQVRYRVGDILASLPHSDFAVESLALGESGHVTGTLYFLNDEMYVPFVTTENAGAIELLDFLASGAYARGGGVNGLGHFVGYSSPSIVYLLRPHSEIIYLPEIPGPATYIDVFALNDADQIAGSLWLGATAHAFRWDPLDGPLDLGDLPGGADFSEAHAINNAGVVVGTSKTSRALFNVYGEAFIWDAAGGMRLLGTPDGGLAIDAVAISADGVVAGTAWTGERFLPYLWTQQGGFTLLGPPPGALITAQAFGANGRGQVVGTVAGLSDLSTAFVADATGGMRDLTTLLDPCDQGRIQGQSTANDINDAGQIVLTTHLEFAGAYLLTPYLPGDLDESGAVELQDLATLLANFGRGGDATFADGDSDCDADVDLQDLTMLLANFGAVLP